jgi:hypothetical protein
VEVNVNTSGVLGLIGPSKHYLFIKKNEVDLELFKVAFGNAVEIAFPQNSIFFLFLLKFNTICTF